MERRDRCSLKRICRHLAAAISVVCICANKCACGCGTESLLLASCHSVGKELEGRITNVSGTSDVEIRALADEQPCGIPPDMAGTASTKGKKSPILARRQVSSPRSRTMTSTVRPLSCSKIRMLDGMPPKLLPPLTVQRGFPMGIPPTPPGSVLLKTRAVQTFCVE
jgi:hypothetical protein